MRPTPADPADNFREDLRTTHQVLKNLTALPPETIQVELEDRPRGGAHSLIEPSNQLAGALEVETRFEPEVEAVIRFRDALDCFRTILLSLIRIRFVSAQQFEAFGQLLGEQIVRFKKSRSHRRLRYRLHTMHVDHLIDRYILTGVDFEGMKEQLQMLLRRSLYLLLVLRYQEEQIRQGFQPQSLRLLINLSYFHTRKLINLMDESKTYLNHFRQDWAEAIFATGAALKLESNKVFHQGLRELTGAGESAQAYVQAEELTGLFRNALQESFTSLARVLNPSFDEFELFPELVKHYEESVRLLDALDTLFQLVTEPPAVTEEEKWFEVIKEAADFHNTSLRHLFARDRESFTQFAHDLKAASPDERGSLLHRLEVYLSTLIGEVRKRSILSKFEKSPHSRRRRAGDSGAQAINW